MVRARENTWQQAEELNVLKAIYDQKWKYEGWEASTFNMEITRDVTLSVTLHPDYPSKAPPRYMLTAPVLSKSDKERVREEFDEIFRYNFGGPVIFQWVEKLKEIVGSSEASSTGEPEAKAQPNNLFVPQIIHGETISDRKSVFQGHVCQISSEEEAKIFRNHLLKKKKICQAKHNVSAYRIKLSDGTMLENHDDDGERRAGGRLLNLMNKLKLVNTMVIVTRWFGGINIGADRFYHYQNAAQMAIKEAGLIE